MTDKTTRREFLKAGGKLTGTVLFAGLSVGCTQAAVQSKKAETAVEAPLKPRDAYTVFSPGQIGAVSTKNRFVRSATMIAAAAGGSPTADYIKKHQELASGGVGTLITGFMIPTRADARWGGQLFVCEDSYIKGLEEFARGVHDADSQCRLFAQIGHSGDLVSPSGIKWPFPWKKKGRALSEDEIENIVTDFSDAVWRIKTAGFDGVELHGAHAYLLSTFLSPQTNHRTDKYGGTLEKRVHIIQAIMDKSRKRVGPDFPIMIKVNSDDNTDQGIRPETFPALADALVKTGVAALDVSGNNCLQVDIEDTQDEAYFFPGAKALDVKTPIMLTGGNRSVEYMEKLLNTGEIDFIGLSRPLIREPDLPDRWLKGLGDERADCISCNGCFQAIMGGRTAYCTQLS